MAVQERRIILAGVGDMAREIARIAENEARATNVKLSLVYFCEKEFEANARKLLGTQATLYSELTALKQACSTETWQVLVTLGAPRKRPALYDLMAGAGYSFTRLISKEATVETESIAPGCVVFPGARLAIGVKLNENILVNYNAVIGHDTEIGAHSVLSPGVSIAGRVTGGREVLYGIGCSTLEKKTIGARAVIAAGSSVWQDVPEEMTMVGVPARAFKMPGAKE